MEYKTEQEEFWAGEFGDTYIERNNCESTVASNCVFFSKIFHQTESVSSIIEFGSNIGLNLVAIKRLLPEAELSAIEINRKAVRQLRLVGGINIHQMSILDFKPGSTKDFVFTKGVLIHINPSELPRIYELLYQTSNHYICIAEYYNPFPVEVTYRGYGEKLFKRDFAGELMDKYKDLALVDYGFVYHKDTEYPQDDITWFLLRKQRSIEIEKTCG